MQIALESPPAEAGEARAVVSEATPIVDIVVPVYNEARVLDLSIRRLHDYLGQRFPFTWRITIADNASTDETWEVSSALAASLPNVAAVRIDRKGRGRALRAAWSASDALVVAYMDVDLSTDLDALLPLVAPLVSGHSDLAIGNRLSSGAEVARGPKREIISRGYNLLLRTVFATRFSDAQCGFKAARSEVIARLLPVIADDGWFFDTELLVLAEHNGLRIHEVPVDWVDDPDSRVDIGPTIVTDLRGVARLARALARGGAALRVPGLGRRAREDDFGRHLVTFGLIGGACTAVSLLVFLLLRPTLGPIGADVVALSTTFVANTWANRHWTLAGRPGHLWRAAFLVYAAGVVLSGGALALVSAAGGGLTAQGAALSVTWTATTMARFAAIQFNRRRQA